MEVGVLCTFATGVLRFHPHTLFLHLTSFLSSEGLEYTSDEVSQYLRFQEAQKVRDTSVAKHHLPLAKMHHDSLG